MQYCYPGELFPFRLSAHRSPSPSCGLGFSRLTACLGSKFRVAFRLNPLRKAKIQLKYLVCLFLEYQFGLGMVGYPENHAENQAALEKTLVKMRNICFIRRRGRKEIQSSMEKKMEYACSFFLSFFFLKNLILTDLHQHGKQLRPISQAFHSAISFSKRKLCPAPEKRTASAMPILLFMRPHDELDHANDLSLKR